MLVGLANGRHLVPTCWQAIKWQAERSPEEVMRQREVMISQLEVANQELHKSGWSARWFDGSDAQLLQVRACFHAGAWHLEPPPDQVSSGANTPETSQEGSRSSESIVFTFSLLLQRVSQKVPTAIKMEAQCSQKALRRVSQTHVEILFGS